VTQESTTSELVRASMTGDRVAFAELDRRYRRAAFAAAFHVLGEHDAAQDAA
jgi:hypothetical protein